MLYTTAASSADCKSVAECADALAQKADGLIADNKTFASQIAQLTTNQKTLEARIASLEAEISKLSSNLITWGSSEAQYVPPAGSGPFNGFNGAGTAGPNFPLSLLSCPQGYYISGIYVDRTSPGLNDVRLACRQLNTALK